ncbi:MAG: NAD(P)H-dependent oxidoreductase, partial [Oscillospiraceae bacterium]|nr:NAD(P)H-dependent oxidoreductase [Oscillospiraceae bacterium]
MKVIGVNGSPNAEGNTFLTIKTLFDELQKKGIDTEILNVGDGHIQGCIACRGCQSTGECAI